MFQINHHHFANQTYPTKQILHLQLIVQKQTSFLVPYAILFFAQKIEQFSKLNIQKQKEIALIFKQEITCGADIEKELNSIYSPTFEFSEEEKAFIEDETSKKVINLFIKKIKETDLTKENLKNLFKEIQNELGVKGKQLYMPLRLKITGSVHGIEMFNIIDILGCDEVCKRLTR